VVDGAFAIDFVNPGRATVVYQVRSALGAHAPRSYTVEPGKQLAGLWPVKAQGLAAYGLAVHGPNGFYRAFRGGVDTHSTRLLVRAAYDEARNDIVLSITNQSEHATVLRVADAYSPRQGDEKRRLSVGETHTLRWPLARTRGWYDLLLTVDGDSTYAAQLAGHVENGRPSISDPAMGA
jgi:phospholipase C